MCFNFKKVSIFNSMPRRYSQYSYLLVTTSFTHFLVDWRRLSCDLFITFITSILILQEISNSYKLLLAAHTLEEKLLEFFYKIVKPKSSKAAVMLKSIAFREKLRHRQSEKQQLAAIRADVRGYNAIDGAEICRLDRKNRQWNRRRN